MSILSIIMVVGLTFLGVIVGVGFFDGIIAATAFPVSGAVLGAIIAALIERH